MALFTRRKHSNRVAADGQDDGPQIARRAVTIGELLRETRQQYGTTVEQIGAALRIRPVFLQAIEDNRYDRLPGPVYALGFVRTYADYLGLDGEAVAQRFKTESAGLETKPDLSFPMPLPERSMPGGALLLVALIVAACAYAIWYYRAAGERTPTERVAEVPSQLIPLPPPVPEPGVGAALPSTAPAPDTAITPPAPSSTSPPAEQPAAAPVGSGTATGTPATAAAPGAQSGQPSGPIAAAVPSPAAPPAPAELARLPAIPEPPATAPPLDKPRVYGVTNGPVRIVIKASADSWVQVRDVDQTVISMRVLKQGETYRVPDRPGLVLRTGNAGGLEITVDDRLVAPVGPAGKTRNVALDPQRLVAGTATLE